jgi:diketogulonate reductase-like aldo/keto reductase
MDIPVKTLKSGFALPVYGLGTWEMGGRSGPSHANDAVELAAIKSAIEHGITHIDTAESYGLGHAEELVGQAIKGFDRSKLIITSKVSRGMSGGYNGVVNSAGESLQRLATDYIDLYLLHAYPGSQALPEVIRAMDWLVEKGYIRNIGVCNMTVEAVQEVQNLTKNKIVCDQVHYSVQMRESEVKGVMKFCQDNDMLVTAWGPLEKGMLDQAGILHELAAKYGKTPFQVALNWLIAQPNVVTIPKTTSVAHLEENLGALGWSLEPEDIEKISKEYPNQQSVSHRVPLNGPSR